AQTDVFRIRGRVTEGSKPLGGATVELSGTATASTATDANGNYAFNGLRAGGSYIITPGRSKTNFAPRSRSIANLTRNESLDFSSIATQECSDEDKSHDRATIINRFGEQWQRNIEGERAEIIKANVPRGVH